MNDTGKHYLIKCRSFWEWSIPDLPEDLTFYKDRKMWLNCITHEEMIFIETEDDEVIHFLEEIGIKLRFI